MLLFDYDGTLTPLVERPHLARLAPATRQLLHRLAARPRVQVGIVSGRSLADLRVQAQVRLHYLVGSGGVEIELGSRLVTDPRAETYELLLRFVHSRLRQIAAAHPGAWVEEKPFGLTLHYRQVARPMLPSLWEKAGGLLQIHASDLRVVLGPMAWEVTPALVWDKGMAVHRIIEAVGRRAVPVYAGDAANDAEALEAVAHLGGFALGVGDSAPQGARYRLPAPADLVVFFAALADALGPGEGVRRLSPGDVIAVDRRLR